QNSVLFPVRNALMYIESRPLGGAGKGFQGASFFTAPNPPLGATFTYYLKESLKTRREKRQQAEQAADKAGQKSKGDSDQSKGDSEKAVAQKSVPYPTPDQLREEAQEPAPEIVLTVTDSSGQVVRRITGPVMAGVHRVSWDLRYPPVILGPPRGEGQENPFFERPSGPLVMPGKYSVSIAQVQDGKLTPLAGPQAFSVTVDGVAEMSDSDRAALVEFQQKAAKLQRAVIGAERTSTEVKARLAEIHRAIDQTPVAGTALTDEALAIEKENNDILRQLAGDSVLQSYNQNVPTSIGERANSIVAGQRMSSARPTQTLIDGYKIAADEFSQVLERLHKLVEVDVVKLQKDMQAAGSPWVP
ncbi:MAG: glycosyl hydrolase, partial [Blastocatellia bacterium]